MARTLTKHPFLKALHLPGVLARLRLLDRIVLTPEGITFEEQRRLTRAMLRRGYRVFSLTFQVHRWRRAIPRTCATLRSCDYF